MSDSWYKVDNVAKVFLATASQRDPRVFRISCTLNEEIDPDTLNEALRSTAQEWPQFQVTLHRGLFWHYFESTDQLPTAQPETVRCTPSGWENSVERYPASSANSALRSR